MLIFVQEGSKRHYILFLCFSNALASVGCLQGMCMRALITSVENINKEVCIVSQVLVEAPALPLHKTFQQFPHLTWVTERTHCICFFGNCCYKDS